MAATMAPAGGITRREFLYYIWAGSLAIFTAEFTGLMVWFMLPRFREGQFGGTFTISVDELPAINEAPVDKTDGRFWLVNLDSGNPPESWTVDEKEGDVSGAAAIYKVCTHLGCIYKWTPANNRFECPCHGSKFRLDGRRIESPAPRSLDRFKLTALDENENELASSELGSDGGYKPLKLPSGARFLRIDTGDLKQGSAMDLLCEITGNCP